MSRRGLTAPVHASAPTGTPRGWSFWSTMHQCWRMWLLRYVVGLVPVRSDEFFTFGSVYHALHEGISEADIVSWGEGYAEALPTAKALYTRRMDFTKSPPLPKATAKEQTYTIDIEGTMGITTKPDQEEMEDGREIPRDFKTAAMFHKYDAEDWGTSGQIIAEMVARGAQSAVVDIIHKGKEGEGLESPSFGKVQQLDIRMSDAKRNALFEYVVDKQRELDNKLTRSSKAKMGIDAAAVFPKSMHCVTKYGLCPYFSRCWEKGSAASFMFKKREPVWFEGSDEKQALRKKQTLKIQEMVKGTV